MQYPNQFLIGSIVSMRDWEVNLKPIPSPFLS